MKTTCATCCVLSNPAVGGPAAIGGPREHERQIGRFARHGPPSTWRGSGYSPGSRKPTSPNGGVTTAGSLEARHVGCGLQAADAGGGGRSICFCGAAIGIADVEEHVYTAHMETETA
jgi:hypothetical protein